MKRNLFFALVAVGSLLSAFAQLTRADVPMFAYGPSAFVASGSMPVIRLTGQSTCSMTLSGAGSATITPKGSSDGGATYGTVSSIGAQSSNGTYGGAASPYLTNFYVAVSGVTGTVTVSEACSSTVTVSGGGTSGPSPTPLPTSLTFSKLVCSLPVLCSPSTGPTPAVAFTAYPSFTGVLLSGITSAALLGTDSGGHIQSVAFPTPGPFEGGTCWQIATVTPGPVYQGNYTCPTPYPTPSANATATACGQPVAATGLTVYVPVCATSSPNPTTHAKLAIALGAVAGTDATSTVFPYQQVVGYTAGEITALRATCQGTGSGNTTFQATDVTAATTIGTVTLSSSSLTGSTSLGTPYALTTGHVLTMTITASGAHTNCSLIAEGQQATF